MGGERLVSPGRKQVELPALWLPLAGNRVLEEYLWGWHLGVVPLGSSKPLGDQRGWRGVPKALLVALPPLQALGTPHPSLSPPTQLVFPNGLPGGPACPMAQAPMAKMDASNITEGPCLEPALLPPRLNGV